MNIIMSYPRSGNHLVRFFIEILSETPTFGCRHSSTDVQICKNIFHKKIPFNISKNYNKKECFYKYHSPTFKVRPKKIIFIIRNPREAILRHNDFNFNSDSFNQYFSSVDYYQKFEGKKKLFFYEDILKNKNNFIEELYDFLDIEKQEKKRYVLDNLEDLFYQSANPVKRTWGGNNSKENLNYYYPKLEKNRKILFDNLLSIYLKEYKFIKNKYNI